MIENPYQPPKASQVLAKEGQRSTLLYDQDDLDVLYCDSRSFRSHLRLKYCRDRGTIAFSSKGGVDFYGRKLSLKGMQLESMELVRPGFPSLAFLLALVVPIGYFVFAMIVNQNWFMGVVSATLILLAIRIFTISWLEVTLQNGDEKTKHCFCYVGGAFGWTTILRGNKELLDYFVR